MKKINKPVGIVFPHQLFEKSPLLEHCGTLILVEEWLFFRQYHFHQKKIAYHRATLKFYENYLINKGFTVVYIESTDERSDIRKLLPFLRNQGIESVQYVEVTDNWLQQRIQASARTLGINLIQHASPLFIASFDETMTLLTGKKTPRQTDFYIAQRRAGNILIKQDGTPFGGKWTFDTENRKRYPAGNRPPGLKTSEPNEFTNEAVTYTQQHFGTNPGSLENGVIYPVSFDETRSWFQTFLKERFSNYGTYQDAILQHEDFMNHSVVSPMLNAGLITPTQLIQLVLEYAGQQEIPLNSTEGFIRQVLGWREYIRGIYEMYGTQQRNCNFWGFTRKIPASFWDGSTGIGPVDITIKKVLKTGYNHHIERLMVLSNFMLLCEFDPDEVYRWFMEMFVDAYDWVMVPNVYGMGQFADGGLMSTKPYISGSNYLKKMADYDDGDWQAIWDALFWHFIHKQRGFFGKNPRMRMMVAMFDKMTSEKSNTHLKLAEQFLQKLDH